MIAYQFQTAAVHTPVFDGPMELLLFLVRREGVDIREVSISPITDAFLGQLDLMAALDLEVAGEFVVMASTLCYLKSREILAIIPIRNDGADEAQEIRENLHRRLQEYARYREASEALSERPLLDRDVWAPQPEPVRGGERALAMSTDALGLLEIYYQILQRKAADPPVHEVAREKMTLKDMADWLLARLRDAPSELADLLFDLPTQGERVMAFLAVLELARLRIVSIEQDHHLAPVAVAALAEADRSGLEGLKLAGGLS